MPEIKLQEMGKFRNMPANKKTDRDKEVLEILERKEQCMARRFHTIYEDEIPKGYYDAMNCINCTAGFSQQMLELEGLEYKVIQRPVIK